MNKTYDAKVKKNPKNGGSWPAKMAILGPLSHL
jgi:hypothetical protein